MSGKSVFVFANSGRYAKPLFKINAIFIDVSHDNENHARIINSIREMIRSLAISQIRNHSR